jgi:hypothetical protein
MEDHRLKALLDIQGGNSNSCMRSALDSRQSADDRLIGARLPNTSGDTASAARRVIFDWFNMDEKKSRSESPSRSLC